MSQTAIFGPVLATVLLTFVVWVTMFARRIPFIMSSGITDEEMAVPGRLAELSPPSVVNPSDNLKNLFEMPVLFYALALVLFVTNHVDGLHLATAWVFVAFRVLHSLVHCTVNVVSVRFFLYLASSLALWFLAGRTALQLFAS